MKKLLLMVLIAASFCKPAIADDWAAEQAAQQRYESQAAQNQMIEQQNAQMQQQNEQWQQNYSDAHTQSNTQYVPYENINPSPNLYR